MLSISRQRHHGQLLRGITMCVRQTVGIRRQPRKTNDIKKYQPANHAADGGRGPFALGEGPAGMDHQLEERTSLDDEQRLRIRAAHAVLENVLPRVAALMKEEPVEA
jgi:hypothetical protein